MTSRCASTSAIARALLLCSALLAAHARAGAPTPAAPQQFARLGDVTLENGAVIHDCQLGYRTLGTLNAARDNAVLVPTWHTGTSAQLLEILGPQGLFDPAPYFVILVDALGNGVSCSPSNSTSQHGKAFPAFTIRDMVASEHRLLTEKLGIHHLRAMVGYSMGGMQTLQWMVSHPRFIDIAIPIAATPRLSSYDLLFWRTAEQAIATDATFAGGDYQRNPPLPLFQMVFALNASSPDYRQRMTAPAGFDKFLHETVAPDPEAPDANDNLAQIRALLTQDIGAGPGGPQGLEQAAARVRARVHLINARQDQLINPGAAQALAPLLHARMTLLDSECGHFAIQCDMAAIRTAIEAALKP
ncbi:alpha/beta fold hydrolase [Rugamonas apoptosis]|uniref:Alpha/beta fold hydrolase n=1 Tax=Rugamonas apoptosis TaxID=2758570 RepID=A0A7W2FBC0_9BURK|nr:alpha/beta fold hydrolase [Rugamonas apoptosis]MBA5688490.1 alpha/beta fold hydrolase [Rugamonas apoptosis]